MEGNWMSYTRVEEYLRNKTDIKLSYDEDGVVGTLKDKNAHLDIYDMKGTQPDWKKGFVECKIEDVKDFLAVFFDNWKEKYDEMKSYEEV